MVAELELVKGRVCALRLVGLWPWLIVCSAGLPWLLEQLS